MSKVVIGVFHDHEQAEDAVNELKEQGFEKEISLIAREGDLGRQDLSEGAFAGGAVGGIAGLLAGAGALLIPGIGPILAAGPLAATLTGVVTGGIAGSLVDYGIPENRGAYYEEQVRQGGILVSLKTEEEDVETAASILRDYGAEDVESHG